MEINVQAKSIALTRAHARSVKFYLPNPHFLHYHLLTLLIFSNLKYTFPPHFAYTFAYTLPAPSPNSSSHH